MSASTKCFSDCIVIVLMLGSGISDARAAIIKYDLSGTATGSLGAAAFENVAINITSTADTNRITSSYALAYQVSTISTNITIEGFPSATFTIPTGDVKLQMQHS